MNLQSDIDTSGLAASRDKLARDIAAIASEASDLLKDAGGRNLQRAQDALHVAQAAIRSGTGDVAEAAVEYVHAHPLKSIGAAAAVGLIAGLLLARR